MQETDKYPTAIHNICFYDSSHVAAFMYSQINDDVE